MKRLAIVILAVFLLAGCNTAMRVSLVDLSVQDMANVEAAKEAAKNFMKGWSFNSGLIRGALGDRISDLPTQFVDALDSLDALYDKGIDTLTDYELGDSLGLRARTLETIVIETLEKIAPDVLKLMIF